MTINLLTLIIFLIPVESGGDDSARRPSLSGGYEVGCLQIKESTVDDINRILGFDHFTYDDRLDRGKSIEMCQLYLGHYASPQRLGRQPTYRDAARIWNGGPNGHRKAATLPYWHRVQARMNRR